VSRIPLIIDDETRPVWEAAKAAAREVASWPARRARRTAEYRAPSLQAHPMTLFAVHRSRLARPPFACLGTLGGGRQLLS
jgi:hypothetical protein